MVSHTQNQVLSCFLMYVIFIFHLYISVILSSPVPQLQFQFPKNGVTFSESKTEKLSFSTSNANDEYKEVQACLDDDYSMPYFNRTTGEFPCHKLLTQGPCEDDEWFVLDEEVRFSNKDGKTQLLPTAICKPKECESIQTEKIQGTNWTQERVLFNGKCANVTSSKECDGDNKVVLVNPFGEGECACKDQFTEWNPNGEGDYFSNEVKCYQEYLQGPCSSGHQLIPKEDVEITVQVNHREIQTPVWLGTNPCQITHWEDAENDFGSMCIPSDCKGEGQVRLKSGECIKPQSCSKDKILVTSTEFTNETDDVGPRIEKDTVSCCLSDDDYGFRKYVTSTSAENLNPYGKKVKEIFLKNSCGNYTHLDALKTRSFLSLGTNEEIRVLSALVTIPESCPRGQTITHDGECKLVRIWRTRPRRSTNSSNRIRQMMRYVRALRRQRPGISRSNVQIE